MPTAHVTFDKPLNACPLCGFGEIHEYDNDYRKRKIFRCRVCQIKFMNPQYTDEYLDHMYSHYIDLERTNQPNNIAHKIASKTDDFQLISRYAHPGRFLAVGCGDGVELEIAAQRGWIVEGYDVNARTTAAVARRTGAKIYTGNFFALDLPADTYDCVYLDQVLEHPKNPADYLAESQRLLKTGGLLYVGCPNIMSMACQYKTILGKLNLKRSNRGRHYDTFHHLFYYTPSVLNRILQRQFGFQVLSVEGTPLTGARHYRRGQRWYDPPLNYVRRKIPALESTFRILARKIFVDGQNHAAA